MEISFLKKKKNEVVAFCPNNNEVHIYRCLPDKWEKHHVLQKVPFIKNVSNFGLLRWL